MSLNGGSFSLLGSSTATSNQTVGTVTLNSGSSTIGIQAGSSQSAALTITTLTSAAGATVNFVTNQGAGTNSVQFTNAPTLSGGVLPFATVNGTAFAAYTGSGPYTLGSASTAAMPTSGVTTTNALVGSGGATLTGSTTVNSLVLSAGGTLNLGGFTLTVTSGGVLAIGGGNASITNGTLAFGPAQGSLLTDGLAGTSLTISTTITGIGGLAISGGISSVTLNGANNAYSAANANAVQTLTLGGTVTGGTFMLSYDGQTTAPIAWNLAAATVATNIQNALAALNAIGAGNVSVLSAGGAVNNGVLFLINFVGALAATAQPQITLVSNNTLRRRPHGNARHQQRRLLRDLAQQRHAGARQHHRSAEQRRRGHPRLRDEPDHHHRG